MCKNITFCKDNNINGYIVSVDQSKAFNSVSHNFIEKALRLFGFREYFVNLVKIIGTKRKASITLENGILS